MPEPKDLIQAFYEKYPYPQPITELPPRLLKGESLLEGCPSWCFHMYWPRRAFTADLNVLIAGCGTSQAALYGASLRKARITAIDMSAESLAHSQGLCERYGLTHVEHCQVDIEKAGDLGPFDLVICTGVLHHMRDPAAGLAALRGAVKPDGSLNLMLYAKLGRAGVYNVQEMVRRLGITAVNSTDDDLEAIRELVRSVPPQHPVSSNTAFTEGMNSRGGASDLFLNPRDQAYTVAEVYELLAGAGLVLQEWHARSLYEPTCLGMKGPMLERAAQLPVRERYAVGELFSTRIIRHRFIACRTDRPPASYGVTPDIDAWQQIIPIRNVGAEVDRRDPQPGRTDWLALPHQKRHGIRINFDPDEAKLYGRIDGQRTIAEIHGGNNAGAARAFWNKLYRYDLVWFRAAPN